jgi:hypothetical protein
LRDDEIDRVLAGEEDVPPSSKFHAAVMNAVQREATAPPPIPFPWKRAWPAFVAAAFVLALSPVVLVQSVGAGPPVFESFLPAAQSSGATWIALAAVVSVGSLFLSRRLCE